MLMTQNTHTGNAFHKTTKKDGCRFKGQKGDMQAGSADGCVMYYLDMYILYIYVPFRFVSEMI